MLAAQERDSARAAAGKRDACVGENTPAAPQLRDAGCQAAAPPPLPAAVEVTVLPAAGADASADGAGRGGRRTKNSPAVQSKSMNRQHRLVRSRLKTVCAAAAAADADHQRTVVQLRDTQRQLLALHERLQAEAADHRDQESQQVARSQKRAGEANCEELLRLRSSCRALGAEFAQVSQTVRGQLLAVPPQMAEVALAVQEAMRRASSSEAVRQLRALLAEEQQLRAIAVARYRKEMVQRKAMYNHLMELKGNIRVFCRVRPLLAAEVATEARSSSALVQLPPPPLASSPMGGLVRFGEDGEIELRSSADGRRHNFEFDSVFQPHHGQSDVFGEIEPLLVSLVDGYDLCIFAYGQTGSGKTYTMEGANHIANAAHTDAHTPGTAIPVAASRESDSEGVYGRTMRSVFGLMTDRAGDYDFVVSLSMLEIYNETICDLLCDSEGQRKTIRIRDRGDGTNDVGELSAVEVHSAQEAMEWVARGRRQRATACTNLNEHSSRSHCVLSLHVRATNTHESLQGSDSAAVTESRLRLIDLAGSERVFRSEATGQRLEETKAINKSLSALGDVIAALKQKSAHVPYRNSKLTHYLQDSLGKKACKTLMLAQVSPALDDHDESLCTLTFAQRVRATEVSPLSKKQKKVKADAKAAAAAASAAFSISSQAGAAARVPVDDSSLSGNSDSRRMEERARSMPTSSSPGGQALSSMEEGNGMPKITARGGPDTMKDDQQQADCTGTYNFDALLNDNCVDTAAEFHAAVPLDREAQREAGFPSERANAGGSCSSNALPSALTVFVDPKPKQRAVRSSSSSLYAKVAALEAAGKENIDRYQSHKLASRGAPAVPRGASEGIAYQPSCARACVSVCVRARARSNTAATLADRSWCV